MDFSKSAFVAPAALPRAGSQLSVSAVRGAPLASPHRVNVAAGRQSPRMDLSTGVQVLTATTIVGVGSFVVLKGRNKSDKAPEKKPEVASKSETVSKKTKSPPSAKTSEKPSVKPSAKTSDKPSAETSDKPSAKPSVKSFAKNGPAPMKSPAPPPTPKAEQKPQPKEDPKKKKYTPKDTNPLTETVGVDLSRLVKGELFPTPVKSSKVAEASDERLQSEVQWALSLLLDIDSCDAAVIVNSRNKIIASAGPLSNNARDAGSVIARVSKSKEPVIESAEVGLSVPFVSSGAKSYGCFPAGDDGVVVAIASRYANFIGDAERSLAESISSRIGNFPLANFTMSK